MGKMAARLCLILAKRQSCNKTKPVWQDENKNCNVRAKPRVRGKICLDPKSQILNLLLYRLFSSCLKET